MTRKRYTRIVRAVSTAHTREGDIEMFTSLVQMTRTPYCPEYGRYLTEPYVFSGNNPHIPRR